jgi:hypothetical protein
MFARTRWQRARRRRRPLPPAWLEILERRVAYYRCLPDAEQRALRGMLQVLLGEMSFEPGAGMERVDEAMRVVVAAQAGLLLMNLPLEALPDVGPVILYPGVYRARERLWTPEGTQIETSEERHGESWSHGVMLLSWEDVRYDLEHVADGQNVVVHEVAHALDDLTGASDGMPPLPDASTAERWRAAFGRAFDELERDVRRRRRTLLDPYALEEPAEFFAVAAEAFLEMPINFRQAYPDLYELFAHAFRLDPAAWGECIEGTEPRD